MSVDVQILRPDPDYVRPEFVIGTNKVGQPLTGADAPLVWRTYLPDATDLTFNRGGNSPDLNALDVGLLSLNLDDADPTDVGLEPGRDVRVVRRSPARTLEFTTDVSIFGSKDSNGAWVVSPGVFYYAQAETAGASVTIEEGSADDTVLITSTSDEFVITYAFLSFASLREFYNAGQAGDWQRAGMRTRANQNFTLNGGTYVYTGNTVWYAMAASSPASSGTTFFYSWRFKGQAGTPLAVTFSNNPNGYASRLELSAYERTLWTGKVSDVAITDTQDGRSGNVAAADAMDALRNTAVNGMNAPWGESFLQRTDKLKAVSPVPLEVLDSDRLRPKVIAYRVSDWTTWGTLPTNVSALPMERATNSVSGQTGQWYRTQFTGNYAQNSRLSGIKTTLTGLNPGDSYTINGRISIANGLPTSGDIANIYAVQIEGMPWVQYTLPKPSANTPTWFQLKFTATSSTHTFRSAMSEYVTRNGTGLAESVLIGDMSIQNNSTDPYLVTGNTREATLTDQLNLLCDSVGALWKPTTSGSVDVRRFIQPSARVKFSDVAEPSYTALEISYATSDLVNALEVTNLTQVEGSEETAYSYLNAASANRWGRRSKQVTLNLHTPAMVAWRAAEILSERGDPALIPTSLTYNAADLGVDLDLHDGVLVERRGEEYLCLVVGISHDVRPGSHEITLTLRKVG